MKRIKEKKYENNVKEIEVKIEGKEWEKALDDALKIRKRS